MVGIPTYILLLLKYKYILCTYKILNIQITLNIVYFIIIGIKRDRDTF